MVFLLYLDGPVFKFLFKMVTRHGSLEKEGSHLQLVKTQFMPISKKDDSQEMIRREMDAKLDIGDFKRCMDAMDALYSK